MVEDKKSYEQKWKITHGSHDNDFEEKEWDVRLTFSKPLKEDPCFDDWFSKVHKDLCKYFHYADVLNSTANMMVASSDEAVGIRYLTAILALLDDPQFLDNSSDIHWDVISGVDCDYWKTNNQTSRKLCYFEGYQNNFNIEPMRGTNDRNIVVVFWRTGLEKQRFPALVILPREKEQILTNKIHMDFLKKHLKEFANVWNDGSDFHAVLLNFEMMQFLKVSGEEKTVLVSPTYTINFNQGYFTDELEDLKYLYFVVYRILKDAIKKL